MSVFCDKIFRFGDETGSLKSAGDLTESEFYERAMDRGTRYKAYLESRKPIQSGRQAGASASYWEPGLGILVVD